MSATNIPRAKGQKCSKAKLWENRMAKIKPGIKIATVGRVLQNEPLPKAGRQHFSTRWSVRRLTRNRHRSRHGSTREWHTQTVYQCRNTQQLTCMRKDDTHTCVCISGSPHKALLIKCSTCTAMDYSPYCRQLDQEQWETFQSTVPPD